MAPFTEMVGQRRAYVDRRLAAARDDQPRRVEEHGTARDAVNTVADDPYVEMCASDATERGLSDGEAVVVRSAQGELTAKLKVNRRFPKGLVFIPENYRALRLNSLMRRGEYPCPVEVERAPAAVAVAPIAGIAATPQDVGQGMPGGPS